MLKNNPDFKEVFTHDHYRFYIPAEHTKYHTSRYVTANNQLIFANAGATADVITAHLDKIIEFCNQTKPMETMRTDIAAICNALLYRTKFPVDEKCGIRMGALLCFMEYEHEGNTISENPNEVSKFWNDKKFELANTVPEIYTFFLTWGIGNIPQYNEVLNTSKAEDYFEKRREAIQMLLVNLPPLANL